VLFFSNSFFVFLVKMGLAGSFGLFVFFVFFLCVLSWISEGFEGALDCLHSCLILTLKKLCVLLHHKIDSFSSSLTLEGLRAFTLLRMRK